MKITLSKATIRQIIESFLYYGEGWDNFIGLPAAGKRYAKACIELHQRLKDDGWEGPGVEKLEEIIDMINEEIAHPRDIMEENQKQLGFQH